MRKMTRLSTALASLIMLGLMAGCAQNPPSDPWDPLEPVNRFNYEFTQKADKYVMKPVAKGYKKALPDRVRTSVGNFFDNAAQPVTMINSLLQLKWGKFNQSLGRFMLNTTVGLGGLFDVASALDVPHPTEDFGQTFGYWGLGPGMYLYIPILGPSDGRDFIGGIADQFANPLDYLNYFDEIRYNVRWLPYVLRVIEGINVRANLLGYEDTLKQQFDPYAFLRSYYLEKRLKAVYDNNVPDELLYPDDSLDEDDYPPPQSDDQ